VNLWGRLLAESSALKKGNRKEEVQTVLPRGSFVSETSQGSDVAPVSERNNSNETPGRSKKRKRQAADCAEGSPAGRSPRRVVGK